MSAAGSGGGARCRAHFAEERSRYARDVALRKQGVEVGVPLCQDAVQQALTVANSFQERCLSRRRLYMFDSETIFECCRSVWRENVKLEDRSVDFCIDMGGPVTLGGYSSAIGHGHENNVGELENWAHENYASCLSWYARRNLKYDADKLNAFAGISRVLCEKIGELAGEPSCDIYGLPTATFDWAILWSAQDVQERIPGLPSWSWCGWTRPINTSAVGLAWDALHKWLGERTWIQWRVYSTQGERVRSIEYTHRTALASRWLDYEGDRTCAVMDPAEVCAIACTSIDASVEICQPTVAWNGQLATLLPLLHFSSLIVHFYLQPVAGHEGNREECLPSIFFITDSKQLHGSIIVDPQWEFRPSHPYAFVVLSEADLAFIVDDDIRAAIHPWRCPDAASLGGGGADHVQPPQPGERVSARNLFCEMGRFPRHAASAMH